MPNDENKIADRDDDFEKRSAANVGRTILESPPRSKQGEGFEHKQPGENGVNGANYSAQRSLLKSASISASKCVIVKQRLDSKVCLNWKKKENHFYCSLKFLCLSSKLIIFHK